MLILKEKIIFKTKILVFAAIVVIYFFAPYEVMYGSDVKKYIIPQNELSLDLVSFFNYFF